MSNAAEAGRLICLGGGVEALPILDSLRAAGYPLPLMPRVAR